VSLEKRGPTSVAVGQPAVFEIVVRNLGAMPVSGLRIEDYLPPGAQLLNSAPTAAVDGQHLSWSLGTLQPGQESRFRIETLPQSPGEIAGRATVSHVVASTNYTTRVVGAAVQVNLRGPETVVVGQPVDLKIRVASLDGQAHSGLVLLIRLPDGLKHVAGKEIETDAFALTAGGYKDIDLQVQAAAGGQQAVQAVVTLAPGQQVSDQATVLVTEVTPIQAQAPRPRSSLVVYKFGPQRLTQGAKSDYRLEVENRGATDITDVTLYDRLPPGLDMGAAGNAGVYDAVTRSVQWRLGTLAPHQKRTVTLRVVANAVGEQRNQVWALGEPNQEAHLTATMQIDSRGSLGHGLFK
jgi:uncharacterized repeat protein (TIGR01451 family)